MRREPSLLCVPEEGQQETSGTAKVLPGGPPPAPTELEPIQRRPAPNRRDHLRKENVGEVAENDGINWARRNCF